jgi:hypothetical protein
MWMSEKIPKQYNFSKQNYLKKHADVKNKFKTHKSANVPGK